MDPTAMFTNVSHFQQVRIKTGAVDHLPESGFVKPWRAGGNNDAVKPVLGDIFPDALLSGFGTGVLDVPSENDIFKLGALLGDFWAIDRSGYVQAAMANIDPDSWIFAMYG
jgi:hypothetical protein